LTLTMVWESPIFIPELVRNILFFEEGIVSVSSVQQRIICVIPARYHSTRLPGKPLAEIGGIPMLQWVITRAIRASMISQVFVATDDERIQRCAQSCGANAIMTAPDLPSGTDRVAAAVGDLNVDIVVNVQGDEPFIEADEIDSIASHMAEHPATQMATLIRKSPLSDGFNDTNSVKVVIDKAHFALYFTRSPVPFWRSRVKDDGPSAYFKHIGVYAYRKAFLLKYVGWAPSFLEQCEKLEQLRVLENGGRIKTIETEYRHLCVDTPEDLEYARRWAESNGKVP